MDATKLIEEAEREIAHMKAEALSAANPYNENTIRLTLLIDLAAALKASEERNGAIRRGLDWERAEREKVAEFARKIGRERDEFAAANLAANQRIVELEQQVADAARAELARLTTPRPIAEAPRDGTWVMGFWDETTRLDAGRYSRFQVVQWLDGEWRDEDGDELNAPTHYLPLPEVKP